MHNPNTEGAKSRKAPLYAAALATLLAVAIIWITQITGAQASLQASNPAIPQGCDSSWAVVSSPNVGTDDNYLYSVTAISANDVWAVGAYTGTGEYQTLTEHWNGTQWSTVPSPNPGGYNNILRGVSGSASNNVWAVGDYSNDSYYSTRHLLTLYWDGANWAEVPNPDPGGNYTNWLNAVDTRAASDAWAVGFYRRYSPLSLVTHFNGAIWSDPNLTGVPGSFLYGIKAIAANDVWAVGLDSFNNHALILHYDGTTWTQVSSAGADTGITLYGVDAASSTDVWTVGGTIEHWNGTAWSTVAAPNAGTLRGVTVISTNDVWAVGDTAFLHWDGTSWSSVAQPTTGALVGIDAAASNDVWSVGSQTISGVQKTLIEHYSSDCSTPIPTVTVAATATATSTALHTATPTTAATATPTNTAIATGSATNTHVATQTTQPTTTTNPSVTAQPSSTTNPSATAPASTDTPIATSTEETTLTPTATPPTATPTASCAITFSDVPEGSTFYPYVRCLVCLGIVQGYPDGTYRPNAPVTRGQAAKIISNSAGWSDIIPPTQQSFNDVPPDSTFWLYAERAYQHGAMQGYPCGGQGEPCPGIYFRPTNTLTRGQIAKVDAIAANYNDPIPPTQQTFSDVPPNSTFWLYIEQVALHGAVSGYTDGTYRPQNPVTRGQLAKIAADTFFPECPAQTR